MSKSKIGTMLGMCVVIGFDLAAMLLMALEHKWGSFVAFGVMTTTIIVLLVLNWLQLFTKDGA